MRIRRRFWHIVAAGVLTTAAWPGGASQCNFKEVFTRPDENGAATIKVYEAKAVSLPSGKRPLLFITSLKVNTDGTKISYHQDDPTGRPLPDGSERRSVRVQ